MRGSLHYVIGLWWIESSRVLEYVCVCVYVASELGDGEVGRRFVGSSGSFRQEEVDAHKLDSLYSKTSRLLQVGSGQAVTELRVG